MSVILQTIIALVAVFIIFSIFNSLLIEVFARASKRRSADLLSAIHKLFARQRDDKGNEITERGSGEQMVPIRDLAPEFFRHPFIAKLRDAEGKDDLSWIPSDVFAETFIDMLVREGGGASKTDPEVVLKCFIKGAGSLPEDLKNAVTQLFRYVGDQEEGRQQMLKNKVAGWYDAYMDRVKEQYKKKAQIWLLWSGIGLAVALNLDVIYIADAFYHQDDLRLNYAAFAEEISNGELKIDTARIADYILEHIERLDANALVNVVAESITAPSAKSPGSVSAAKPMSALPIGLGGLSHKLYMGFGTNPAVMWLLKVLGICLMGWALSRGAPFWFDFLKKLVQGRKMTGL